MAPESELHTAVRSGVPRELRLPLLLLVLLGCCFVLIKVLPRDPILYDLLRRTLQGNPKAAQERLVRQLRANDPPLGSVLPVPPYLSGVPVQPARSASSPNRESRALLVLMIGPCSDCVLATLHSASELKARRPELGIVAVSPTPLSELKRFRESHNLRIDMVSDGGGRLAARYNAAWTPRAYLLDASGRLLWCQPDQAQNLLGSVEGLLIGQDATRAPNSISTGG